MKVPWAPWKPLSWGEGSQLLAPPYGKKLDILFQPLYIMCCKYFKDNHKFCSKCKNLITHPKPVFVHFQLPNLILFGFSNAAFFGLSCFTHFSCFIFFGLLTFSLEEFNKQYFLLIFIMLQVSITLSFPFFTCEKKSTLSENSLGVLVQ